LVELRLSAVLQQRPGVEVVAAAEAVAAVAVLAAERVPVRPLNRLFVLVPLVLIAVVPEIVPHVPSHYLQVPQNVLQFLRLRVRIPVTDITPQEAEPSASILIIQVP
jgi:hypothetical protein